MRLACALISIYCWFVFTKLSALAVTPQLFDRINFDNNTYSVITPLFERSFPEYGRIEFTAQSSDNNKGYEATWNVDTNALYLESFSGWLGQKEVYLKDIWPDGPTTPKKATWVSGEVIVVPGVVTTDSIGRNVDNAISLFFVDGELVQSAKLPRYRIGSDEGGVGIFLNLDHDKRVVVEKVLENSPCAKCPFIRPGCKIIAIETHGKRFDVYDSQARAIGLLRGRIKTDVTIHLSGQENETESFTLERVSLADLARDKATAIKP